MPIQSETQPPHSARDFLQRAIVFLEKRGVEASRIDAELLLCDVLGLDRLGLMISLDKPLNEHEVQRYRKMLARRGRHEPVAYILGYKDFYGRRFRVSSAVLIPRPETELLVDAAVARLRDNASAHVLDIGTGTGNIGISVMLEKAAVTSTLVDVSQAALEIAKSNVEAHELTERVDFICADFLTSEASWDAELWLSNPPYVARSECSLVSKETQLHEPEVALFGEGDFGESFYIGLAKKWLQADAAHTIILEHGFNQGDIIDQYFEQSDVEREIIMDYEGHQRIRIYQKRRHEA